MPVDREPPRDASRAPADDAVLHGLSIAAADAATQDYPASALYVIGTPIGNRADITVRALACLVRVDAVAAEDTRTARSLLRHYGLDKPMIAAHRHNEHEAADRIVARLAAGDRIAYVSDAGTPGVSDPGARIVAAVRDAGLRVVPIPGASALTTALSAAGLAEGPVQFVGFLPSKGAQAAAVLQSLASTRAHLVFYEAPHRIVEMLQSIGTAFAGRSCVIARELTKRFEAIHRSPAEDAATWIAADADRQRGEFVVIVEAPDVGAADA
jgi:16S rRNA (cytidine1402-2'-O)-methyltransferase